MQWHTGIPTDDKQKLCYVYNIFQERHYYVLAYYNQSNRWGNVGGKVERWIDLEELISDGAPAIDRMLKAEADLSVDGLDYIERGRAVRIVRGLE